MKKCCINQHDLKVFNVPTWFLHSFSPLHHLSLKLTTTKNEWKWSCKPLFRVFWKRSFSRKIVVSCPVGFCHDIKWSVKPPLLVSRDIFFVVWAASSTNRDFKPSYLTKRTISLAGWFYTVLGFWFLNCFVRQRAWFGGRRAWYTSCRIIACISFLCLEI